MLLYLLLVPHPRMHSVLLWDGRAIRNRSYQHPKACCLGGEQYRTGCSRASEKRFCLLPEQLNGRLVPFPGKVIFLGQRSVNNIWYNTIMWVLNGWKQYTVYSSISTTSSTIHHFCSTSFCSPTLFLHVLPSPSLTHSSSSFVLVLCPSFSLISLSLPYPHFIQWSSSLHLELIPLTLPCTSS